MTGYPRSAVLGRNCRFLQGPGTDPAAMERLRRCVHAGCETSVEILNYRADGRPFWNLLSVTPVRDAAGRLVSFIGVQSDVTELVARRETERQLQVGGAGAGG